MRIRGTVFVVLPALVAALALLGGCRKREKADLVLASPHSDQIQQEFQRAFIAWYQKKYHKPVTLEWRDLGGTTQITKYVYAQHASGNSSGIDVYFGGGAPDMNYLANSGALVPIKLPKDIMDQLPAKLTGVPQYDPQGRWYGACVSIFGILCNESFLHARGIETPTRWADLTSPKLRGLLVAAGPESGSGRAAYEMMIQTAANWPAGWARLLEFWGNCQKFTQGATDAVTDVSTGQAAAATAIDYYARMEIRAHPGSLKFVLPDDGTVYTPDPIAILAGAPHPEMARRFVEFVLSPEGQALWCLPVGAPGGPTQFPLYRQPIRKDTYRTLKGKMLPELVDIYKSPTEFHFDEKVQAARVTQILPRLMRAAAMDNANRLRQAWGVVVAKGEPANLVAQFTQLPANLATQDDLMATAAALAKHQAQGDDMAVEEIVSGWTDFFRQKYDRIIHQGQ